MPAEIGKGNMETRTREEFAIVERVARIISSVRGTKSDYTPLAAELELAIPFDIFGIVLLRHDRQAVRVTVCHREEYLRTTRWVAVHHQHPLESSMLEQVLRAPMLMVKEYEHGLDGPPAACGDALSGYHQLHSTLIVPLTVEERVLGTLELGAVASHTYTHKALQRLVSAVARVLATAIEGVQLGGSTEIQNRQRQVLKEVSSALTSKTDLPTILSQIVTGIARSLNVASAVVLYDRRVRRLRLEAFAGLEREAFEKICTPGESEEDIIGYTLHQCEPFTASDLTTDERFPANHSSAQELNVRSVYTFPLMAGATIYGVLLLCSPEPGGFTPLKADILSLFASQATIAIHNSMLLESMLSSVSHDLRTPLTTIKAAVTGLLQAGTSWSEHDRLEMLKDIDSETDHLTVMIDALVEMSRIEMGALILEKEWCDIVEVIYGTQAKLERALVGHPLRLDLQPHLSLVYADHAQLGRVFYNLIDNAARRSPQNTEVVVAIDVVDNDMQEASLRALRVRVIDGGSCVRENEREHIFRSFYGFRSWGRGSGLAISKGIIEAHGGHIWVEPVLNDEGKPTGSCFVFTLPVHTHSVVSIATHATSENFVSKGSVLPPSSLARSLNPSQFANVTKDASDADRRFEEKEQ